jgi:hypothetical protein
VRAISAAPIIAAHNIAMRRIAVELASSAIACRTTRPSAVARGQYLLQGARSVIARALM